MTLDIASTNACDGCSINVRFLDLFLDLLSSSASESSFRLVDGVGTASFLFSVLRGSKLVLLVRILAVVSLPDTVIFLDSVEERFLGCCRSCSGNFLSTMLNGDLLSSDLSGLLPSFSSLLADDGTLVSEFFAADGEAVDDIEASSHCCCC